MLVAGAPEDDRGLPGRAGARRAGRRLAPGARQPRRSASRCGVVLDAVAQHDAAVELGRRAAARAPRARLAGLARRVRTASAVEVAARPSRAGQLARAGSARTAPSACGWETHDADRRRARARRARSGSSGRRARPRRRSRTSGASSASASSVALTPPSSEFSIGTSARLDRRRPGRPAPSSWIVGERHGSRAPAQRRRPQRLVAERARRPEVAARRISAAARRRRGLARQRDADRLLLLGRELELAAGPRRPAWRTAAPGRGGGSRRATTPERARVEQRDRGRLAPGHLVVGVVAHQPR